MSQPAIVSFLELDRAGEGTAGVPIEGPTAEKVLPDTVESDLGSEVEKVSDIVGVSPVKWARRTSQGIGKASVEGKSPSPP